jgi:hypothetical protein
MKEETLEEALNKLKEKHTVLNLYPSNMLKNVAEFGAKWQQEQDRWKTVFEETPPSNIELLAESPDGVVHLTDWRAGYQIFSCQVKSESSDDWKWKTI